MMQPAPTWKAWCLLAVALWPALGQAQAPGGNGIKVGEGRLHPFFTLETRLDSAAGYFPPPGNLDPTLVSDRLSGEALLHFRPGLRLELPASSRLYLNLMGHLDYVHYTGLLTPGSSNASRMQGMADVNLRFNQDTPMVVEVGNHFERTDRTRTAALGVGVLSLFNEVRVAMPLRPGGGALEITPKAAWAVELFQPMGSLNPVGCTGIECNPAEVRRFDYSNLRANLLARWRFLPKTAVVVDTQFDARTFFHGAGPNALLLQTSAGLAGLISPKLTVTAKAGWAQDFGVVGRGGMIGQLEGAWTPTHLLSAKAGYGRMMEPVAVFGLFRDDRGYLEGQMLLGGRLTLRGTTSLDYLSFQDASNPRRDILFRMNLGPEYLFQRWLVGGVGYLLETRASSTPGAGINYTRHEGYARMTVMY
jgi:hypothetical protein